jgi:peptide/nickel transport system substrate-binding protein
LTRHQRGYDNRGIVFKERAVRRRAFNFGLPIALAGLVAKDALAADPRAVTVAFPIDIPDWIPTIVATPTTLSIVKCVFDQPMEMSPNLALQPALVTGYKWLDETGQTLQVDLRNDVTFHNGDKFTSADVRFTYYEHVKANPLSLLAGTWHVVTEIETPTPSRAIMHFKNPFVIGPSELSDLPAVILPKAYFEKVGMDGFRKKPIGTGPYRLVDYQRSSRIVLEAYDKHWRGPARIKRLTFQIVADPVARAAAVQSGQVDITLNLPVREVERLGGMPGLEPRLNSTTGITLLQMVNKGVLKDRNVRLAAHYALNKPAISKALTGGHMTPIWMPAGPGMPGYVPGFKLDYDPGKAKALLAQSGYSTQKPVIFNFYGTNGVFPSDFDIARAIVQMWKRVGIEAELKILPSAQLYEYQSHNKFDGPVLKPWNPTTGDPAVYSGYMLDPQRYYSVWRSDDVPPRLYPLRQILDDAKRLAAFKAFDQWQVSQGYSIPLFQGLATVVARKNLGYRPFRSGFLVPYSWS